MGFIRNLPHTLVTSFRATLEEVAQAEVLLHVRDAASTYGEEQKSQVEKVLGELESLGKPRLEVLNKIDLLGPHEREGLERRSGATGEVAVSALTGEGMDALLAAIDAVLHSDRSCRLSCVCRSRKAPCWLPLKRGWWCTAATTRAIWCASGSAVRHRSWDACENIGCGMIERLIVELYVLRYHSLSL